MNRRHSLFLIVACWAGVTASSGWAADDPKNERIERALQETVTLEFPDTTLKKAAQFISQLHNVEIEIDLESLKEIGIDETSKVSYKAERVRMKEALSGMLLSVHEDLAYEVKDGKLRFVAKK
jgi:hypothetical protein